MVLACVMMLAHVMILACVIVLPRVMLLACVMILGEASNRFFGKIGDFVPTGGGGSANPKFLSNFSKTKFALELPINVMKHIIHRWGVDISSIHVVIGPPIRHPNQKK